MSRMRTSRPHGALVAVLALTSAVLTSRAAPAQDSRREPGRTADDSRRAVAVELFTSQG